SLLLESGAVQRELGGVDVFHLVRDREMRARGLAGNHCAYVLELEGHVDASAVDRRLARAVELVPELGARLRNGFPPRWVTGSAAPPRALVHADDGSLASIEARLAARLDEAWALDVLRGERRDRLVLRWFHPFADGRSAERLARWLGSG